MKVKPLLLSAFISIISLGLSAQVSGPDIISGTNSSVMAEISAPVGTYQLLLPVKPAYGVTEEYMKTVRVQAHLSRKQSEQVVINLTENILLRIPSKDEILSQDFIPLEEIEYYQ